MHSNVQKNVTTG